METKSYIGLFVAITVGVILVAALLVPVIGEAQKSMTTETKTNDDYFYTMTDQVGEYAYTIEDGALLVNGEKLQLGENTNGFQTNCAITPMAGFIFVKGINALIWGDIQTGSNNATWGTFHKDGTYEASINGTTHTGTDATSGLFAVNGGNIGSFVSGASFNVTDDEKAYFGFNSNFKLHVGDNVYPFMCMFSLKDGVVTTEYAKYYDGNWKDATSTTTATYSGSYEEKNGYGTYTGTGYTVSSTLGTVDGTNPHLGIYAPIEYTETTSNSMSSLIGVIPVMVLVSFIVGVAGVTLLRSRE